MKTNASSTPATETHSTTSANSPTNADVKKKQKEKPKEPTKFRLLRRRDARGGELCSGGANGEVPPGPAKGRIASGSSPEERG